MTVFQRIRDERLRRAKEMLEGRGLSVTETAFAVGYDSISHFSQAYKKRFGDSPGKKAGIEGGGSKSSVALQIRRDGHTV
jgi:transcriptional regulator GlxA family with amidase domain